MTLLGEVGTEHPRRVASLLAGLGVLAVGIAAWPYTVDDAYLVARYAQHLAAGEGWVMNPGAPPSDGVTGPLWVLPALVGESFGLRSLAIAKGLGLAAGSLAAALAAWTVGRRQGGRIARWVVAAICIPQVTLGVWAVAGLETGLATLFATVAAAGVAIRPASRWMPVVVGASLGLLAWLRPELALFAAALLGGLWLRDRRAALIAIALAAAGAASVVVWRLASFGAPWPLSFLAKPGGPTDGLPYALQGLLVVTGLGGLALAAVAVREGRARDRSLGVAVAVHLLAVVAVGGDWMPGFRLLAPVLPTYALVAGSGADVLWRRGSRPRLTASGLVLLAVAVPAVDLAVQLPRVREAGDRREEVGRPFAAWLAARGDRVALVDAGFLPYAGGFEVVDLGGLTDPAVARAAGGHLSKRIDPGWLATKSPDLIVLHAAVHPEVDEEGNLRTLAGFGVERQLAAMAWVRAHYRVARVLRYAPDYWYVVLTRRGGSVPGGAAHERDIDR